MADYTKLPHYPPPKLEVKKECRREKAYNKSEYPACLPQKIICIAAVLALTDSSSFFDTVATDQILERVRKTSFDIQVPISIQPVSCPSKTQSESASFEPFNWTSMHCPQAIMLSMNKECVIKVNCTYVKFCGLPNRYFHHWVHKKVYVLSVFALAYLHTVPNSALARLSLARGYPQ